MISRKRSSAKALFDSESFIENSEKKGGVTLLRRRATRAPALLALASMLASIVIVISPATASAAESTPPLQYPAVGLAGYTDGPVPGASGSMTLPCNILNSGADLVTYNSSGTLVRQLDRTQFIDGVQNCITNPVVDKNDVLYGITNGKTPSGSYANGQYLYAYAGSTLK